MKSTHDDNILHLFHKLTSRVSDYPEVVMVIRQAIDLWCKACRGNPETSEELCHENPTKLIDSLLCEVTDHRKKVDEAHSRMSQRVDAVEMMLKAMATRPPQYIPYPVVPASPGPFSPYEPNPYPYVTCCVPAKSSDTFQNTNP